MDDINFVALGHMVRELRKGKDWSQEDLAKKMGVPQGWISEIENGKRKHMEAQTLYRFCRLFGVSADYLLGLPGAAPPAREPQRASRRRAHA